MYKIQGKIVGVFDAVNITDKFVKRDFIISIDENCYTNKNGEEILNEIKFQTTQDDIRYLDGLEKGNLVSIEFDIIGRRYKKDKKTNFFVNLDATKVELVGSVSEKPEAPEVEESDDLPF